MSAPDGKPWPSFTQAVCKTGLAASSRRMMVHRVESLRCYIRDGRAEFWAEWVCGGSTNRAVILTEADVEPLGGICSRCETAGWFMYRCRDNNGLLLYIGSSGNLYLRFKNHARNTPWWPDVADIEKVPYPSEAEARAAERHAILAESPLHNKQPAGRARSAA